MTKNWLQLRMTSFSEMGKQYLQNHESWMNETNAELWWMAQIKSGLFPAGEIWVWMMMVRAINEL